MTEGLVTLVMQVAEAAFVAAVLQPLHKRLRKQARWRPPSYSGDNRTAAAEEAAAQAEAGSIAVAVTSETWFVTVPCEFAVALCSAASLGLFLLLDLDCPIHSLSIVEFNLSLCSNTEHLNPNRLNPLCYRQWFG